MMKKLLVTGGSGFLGWNICRYAACQQWQLYATVCTHPIDIPSCRSVRVDLRNYDEIKSMISDIQPDAVIHTAAISNPDFCQKNSEESYGINVIVPKNIAGICAQMHIPFVFTSTDLVFDGKNAPYTEKDQVSPVSKYGEQKVRAEQDILSVNPGAAVCRMPLMFGDPSPVASSFIQWIITGLKEKNHIRLFFDEFRTPISAYTATQGLLLACSAFHGIVHLGGRERISRYDFGKKVAQLQHIDSACMIPVSQKDAQTAAPRPADVSLDSSIAFDKGYAPLFIDDELVRLQCMKKSTT